jgi:hypothetical protein
MKHPVNSRRSRNGRNGSKRGYGQNGNRSLESNGPDVKVRGTASQIFDKYISLARDATGASDRIAAESYFQYAEHYHRLVNAASDASSRLQQSLDRPPNGGAESEEEAAQAAADSNAVKPVETDLGSSDPNPTLS